MKQEYRFLYSSALVLSAMIPGTVGEVAGIEEQDHYSNRYGNKSEVQDSVAAAIESKNEALRNNVRKAVQEAIHIEGVSSNEVESLHNIVIAGITGSIDGMGHLEEYHNGDGSKHPVLSTFLTQLHNWLSTFYNDNKEKALKILKSQIALQYPEWKIDTKAIVSLGEYKGEYGNADDFIVPITGELEEFRGKNVKFEVIDLETQNVVDRFKYSVKIDRITKYISENGMVDLPTSGDIKVMELAAGQYEIKIFAEDVKARGSMIVHPKKVNITLNARSKTYDGTTEVVIDTTTEDILERDSKDARVIAKGKFPSEKIGIHAVEVSELRLVGTKSKNYTLLPWNGQLNASIFDVYKEPSTPGNTPVSVTLDEIAPAFIRGSAKAGAKIEVDAIEQSALYTRKFSTTAGADGKWSVTLNLDPGNYKVKVKATDADGNTATTVPMPFEIPTPPSVTLNPITPTRNPKPTIGGTAEPTGTKVVVEIRDSSNNLIQTLETTADANETWSLTPDTDLAEGTYNITAKAGDATSDPITLEIDQATHVTLNTPTVTHNPAPLVAINGTAEAGAIITITIENVSNPSQKLRVETPADTNGDWDVMFTPLPIFPLDPGTYNVTVEAIDAAGNTVTESSVFEIGGGITEGASYNVTLDTITPINNPKPTINGTVDPGGTEVMVEIQDRSNNDIIQTLLATADPDGAWSVTLDADLPTGEYKVRAVAPDGFEDSRFFEIS